MHLRSVFTQRVFFSTFLHMVIIARCLEVSTSHSNVPNDVVELCKPEPPFKTFPFASILKNQKYFRATKLKLDSMCIACIKYGFDEASTLFSNFLGNPNCILQHENILFASNETYNTCIVCQRYTSFVSFSSSNITCHDLIESTL
jgi:hypothetical protein